MINLKIILPGEVPVKKNTVGQLWFRVDKKTGRKIPLAKPIMYYKDNYKRWIKENVIRLELWKRKHPELSFPLKGSFTVSFIMFRKHKGTVDLSNLYEAPQDLLNGHAGNFLDKYRMIEGEKVRQKYDHNRYKVLDDDDCKTITCHGASTVIYVPKNPRLEIFITNFDLGKIGFLLRELHPNQKLTDFSQSFNNVEEPNMFNDNPLADLLKDL